MLVLCLLAVAGAPRAAQADVAGDYRDARSLYLELKRRDPRVGDLMEWERAASRMLSFLREHENERYRARAFYTLGRLYEKTWRERKFRTGLSRALYFYEKLAREHQGSNLADDALLFLGDLRGEALGDAAAARSAYYEIVDTYPGGDMQSLARKRLGLAPRAEREFEPPQGAPAEVPEPEGEGEEVAAEKPVEPQEEPGTERAAPPSLAAVGSSAAGAERPERGGLLSMFGGPWVGSEGKEIYAERVSHKRPVIVIDPGHGGEEEGAHGVDGVLEKEVVLEISLMLDELLRKRLRAETVLTRRTDRHVPLAERTRLANKHDADLFISVHANASEYKTAKGVETYYLDNTNDRSSLKLARRENQSLGEEPVEDLDFILSDLIQNAKLEDSISLAHHVQDRLHATLSRYYRGVRNLGVKKAPFYVLVGAHMPCILAEVSFIDHPVEGRRLATQRYQKLVAMALYEGIRSYFESVSDV